MRLLRSLACVLALAGLAPAWAVNKCTLANGRVAYQDAPCPGRGETLALQPDHNVVSPVAPNEALDQEGAFGQTWQRKNYLSSQGLPQAREALAAHQRNCAEQQREVAQRGQLRGHLARGSVLTQAVEEDARLLARECSAREEALRNEIATLEAELNELQSKP